ncbi:hypothetical protein [Phaeobacter sp. NW0010-22]
MKISDVVQDGKWGDSSIEPAYIVAQRANSGDMCSIDSHAALHII